MRLALDTNRYRDLVQGDPYAAQCVQKATAVFVPLPVLAELRGGFLCGTRPAQNEAILARFLNNPRVSILHPDEQTTRYYANIYLQLRQQGTPIPVNDMWIAALVMQHNLHLFTRDRDFDHLPQIPRV
jgi:tRNA(fMet)-specific endonuclease VapC